MCPLEPTLVLPNISAHTTDEELVVFLWGRRVGDPVPDNVTTEVNPFSIILWHSSENMWYLYHSDDPQSRIGEGEIKVTGNGYWRSLDAIQIFASPSTVGTKTTWEYYVGQAPFGDRTGWMMHEYQTEQKTHLGVNEAQDCCSLCRVFLQTNQSRQEQHNSVTANDAEGEYLECELLNLLEQEENFSREAANRSQAVGGNEHKHSACSGKSSADPVNDNSLKDMFATCDFAKGDFLELNDLYSPETSSFSSDNSSLMSGNFDDYFDADALLRDLENEHSPNTEEEHVECNFSISTSVRSNQVIVKPPLPGSVCSNSCNLVVEASPTTNPSPESGRVLGLSLFSTNEEQHNDTASTSESKSSEANQGLSEGYHSGRTRLRHTSKSVGRIAKLGKKYCCFASF